jgi:aspartyl-tRNA(Asn)/glutamyl-tRNA(Gln) amidotransferase subunit A
MALAYSMDKIGPMARSAEDCTHIFAAIAGHDPLDRSTLPVDKAAFTYSPAADLKGRNLRIGWLTNAWKPFDPSIAKILETAKSTLRKQFPSTKDAVLPDGPWEDAATLVLAGEVGSSFAQLIRSGQVRELVDPIGRVGGYVSQSVSGADYTTALRIREILQKKMSELFDSYDVLAAASLPITATPLSLNLATGLNFPDPLGAIGNLCGLPAISVPCGLTEKNLPVGLQFIARAGDDTAVLQAARLFQQTTSWHRKHPKLT